MRRIIQQIYKFFPKYINYKRNICGLNILKYKLHINYTKIYCVSFSTKLYKISQKAFPKLKFFYTTSFLNLIILFEYCLRFWKRCDKANALIVPKSGWNIFKLECRILSHNCKWSSYFFHFIQRSKLYSNWNNAILTDYYSYLRVLCLNWRWHSP